MAREDIGDVSVDVTANADGFADDAKRQIDKEAPGIGEDFGEDVGDGFDDAFKKQLAKTLKDIKKQIDGVVKDISKDLKLDVDVDVTEAKEHLENFVDKESKKNINLLVELTTALASSRLAILTRQRFVNIVPRVSKKALAEVATQLAAISGLRLAKDYGKNILDFIRNLDRSLPTLTLLSTGITSVVASLGYLSGGIVTVATDLAALWPLILAAPGLIAQFGISLGVLIPALKDLDDILGDLKPQFSALQDVISKKFWSGAEGPIRTLVKDLMPGLKQELGEVATAYGGLVGALADSVREVANARGIQGFFAGLAESVTILTTGTDALASALHTLGTIGERYLPRLSQWAVDLTTQFDAWLTKVNESGELDQMLETAISTVKLLADSLGQAVGIIKAIDDAATAAGGGGLQTFQSVLAAINEAMNTPEFQAGLTSFFAASSAAMEAFAPVLSSVGDLFYDLREPIAYFIEGAGKTFATFLEGVFDALNQPEVGEGLKALIDGLLEGVTALVPYLPDLADGFAEIAEFAGELAAAIGPVIGAALPALSEGLGKLLEAIGPELPALSKAIVDAIIKLTPSFITLVEAVAPLLPKLLELITTILPPLVDFINALFTPTSDIAYAFADWLETMGPVGQLLAGVVNGIGDLFAGATSIFDVIDNVSAKISEFVGGVQDFIGGIQSFFADVAKTLQGIWDSIGLAVGQFLQFIVALFQGRFDEAAGFLNGFLAQVRSIFQQVADFVGARIQDVMNFIGSIKTGVMNALSGASKWLVGVGKDIINGLINGITGAITGVGNALKDGINGAINGVRNWLGIHSPSTLLRDLLGINMGEGVAEGLLRTRDVIADALRSAIQGPVVQMGNQLQAAGAVGTSVAGSSSSITNNYGYTTQSSPSSTTSWTVESGAIPVYGSGDPAATAQEAINRLAEKVGIG